MNLRFWKRRPHKFWTIHWIVSTEARTVVPVADTAHSEKEAHAKARETSLEHGYVALYKMDNMVGSYYRGKFMPPPEGIIK